jgi:uncharacterized RDD family membrane protein YckC
MSDNDEWNFEVKVDEDESSTKKKKKKTNTKPLLKSANKNKKLEVNESSQPERKSRRQMAREAGGTSMGGRDIVDPAPHGARFIAFIIDSLIIAPIIIVAQLGVTFFPGLGTTLEEYLGPEIISSIPLDIGGLFLAFVIHFITIIVPMASSQQSIGKKLMKIKILGTLKPKAPIGVIVIREYIAKPISILSFIGIFIIFLNKKRRGFHDFFSGTFLIKK